MASVPLLWPSQRSGGNSSDCALPAAPKFVMTGTRRGGAESAYSTANEEAFQEVEDDEDNASGRPDQRLPSRRLLAFLGAVSALEGADAMLLPASFRALQLDLALTPLDLASMSLAQALMSSLAAPVWGILADRGVLPRRIILAFGALGWGVVTLLLAAASSRNSMLLLRAVNGSLLACLGPVCQGIVADVTAESKRGEVLGLLGFLTLVGSMLASLITTPISRQMVLGVQGWRVAFSGIGAASIFVAVLIWAKMEEPEKESWGEPLPVPEDMAAEGELDAATPSKSPKTPSFVRRTASFSFEKLLSGSCWASSMGSALGEEAFRLRDYLQTPTFMVIVLQGCFGGIPWNAMGFSTMYFQQVGLSDFNASLISALGQGCTAIGTFSGGRIGDALARHFPDHGRPLTAQISVTAGIPCVFLMFWVLPATPASLPWYALLTALMGLTASWCATGVNRPILSEIVSPNGRSVIMAWDAALEGSMAALFGAPAVGFLSERVFGYKLETGLDVGGSNASLANDLEQANNTRALGLALVWATSGPWLLCLSLYTFLHWSYPKDRARVAALKAGGSWCTPHGTPKAQVVGERSEGQDVERAPLAHP
ncbi:unnamed protein product [Polarella glacialis]|uniref:Major facilitator superfamily (MFS) profile domain-containing protein n=1 Tax=Polarella glacialis TaxID=89957 RepID=A0A813ED14_POLGL|nr:unnamed protein product [Polarella glacialis]